MKSFKIKKSYTVRTPGLVSYFKDIYKYPTLTAQEELKCLELVKQGDSKAVDLLIKSNLRFVVSVAKQYEYFNVPLLDLINEGNIGLIEAIKTFDSSKGIRFLSYAVWYIRHYIINSINNTNTIVKYPKEKININLKLETARNILEQKEGRSLSEDEVLYKENIDNIVKIKDQISLETEHSEGLTLLESIDSGENTTQLLDIESLRISLYLIMDKYFSYKEKYVITHMYGLEKPELSVYEISKNLKITKARVLQIQQKALLKFQKYNKNLKQYLN